MGLFESKAEREARERVALKMGRKAVREYINSCNSAGSKYLEMARKALSLGQRKQAEHYIATHLQYDNQANRWESFMLKIDDIVLRGNAMKAMGGLMGSVQHLCKNVTKGLSAKDIQSTMISVQRSMGKVEQAESQLGNMLGSLDFDVGPSSFEQEYDEMPDEMRGEVTSMCDSLLNDVKVKEGISGNRLGRITSGKGNANAAGVDDQMERLNKLRKNRNG